MAYWGYDFCVSTTSNIGWPQQPLTEKISDIRLKIGFLIVPYTKRDFYWSFWCQGWSNHQNEEKYWGNRAVEAVEAIEVAEADEVTEAAEVLMPEKSLMRSSVSSRFWFSTLFWCFEKTKFGVESWNTTLNFSTFSVGGCWGQPMFLFKKLVYETQMSKPPEASRHNNSTKLLILLPLRANWKSTKIYIYEDFFFLKKLAGSTHLIET